MRSRFRKWPEALIEGVIRLCGFSAVVFVFGIFFFVGQQAFPLAFNKQFHFLEFFTSQLWYPTSEVKRHYGVLSMIFGTASITFLSMLLAVPFGIGAAIYISEFSSPRARETLKVLIEFLAAIPSVVWGFVGLSIFSRLMVRFTGSDVGVNMLNGALLLALMSVPVIVSLAEDALRAVPDTYREAALAMGATHWQMIWRVLLPGARSGLVAAVLLGVGRAIGETMAVLMSTGHAVQISLSPLEPVRTLTANIAAELGEAPVASTHYQVLFLSGVLLFLISFLINVSAAMFIRKGRQQ